MRDFGYDPPANERPLVPASRIQIETCRGVVAGWRWPQDGAQKLLFCHANGFCASTYKTMLAPLSGSFDVTAIDMRGHGLTRLPADPARLVSWDVYGADVAAVVEAMGGSADRPIFLAGHSFGAVAAALAAAGRRDIAGLALIEPVALPPLMAAAAGLAFAVGAFGLSSPLARGARGRRRDWPDREAVRASYARKPLFAAWAPGVLEDYLEDGLRADDAGVRLACAPAWEAATFSTHTTRFWSAVRRRPAPMSVLAAAHPRSTVFAGSAGRFERLGVSVKLAQGVSHLAPMEDPAGSAAFIANAASAGRPAR